MNLDEANLKRVSLCSHACANDQIEDDSDHVRIIRKLCQTHDVLAIFMVKNHWVLADFTVPSYSYCEEHLRAQQKCTADITV